MSESAGKLRRWRGQYFPGVKYYSFEEFLAYVQDKDIKSDCKGHYGHEAVARSIWEQCIPREQDLSKYSEWRSYFAASVAALKPITLEDLQRSTSRVSVVLQNSEGLALRYSSAGDMDLEGGADAEVSLEVVKDPLLMARVWSPHGGCLRRIPSSSLPQSEKCARVDFRGSSKHLEGTIFQVIIADGVAVIDIPDGCRLVLRHAKPPEESLWRQDLRAAAKKAAAADPELQGVRSIMSEGSRMYTFEELVMHADAAGWGGPIKYGALYLAKAVWKQAGPPRFEAEEKSIRKTYPLDDSKQAFTFEEWTRHVEAKNWAGPVQGGSHILATLLWKTECVPAEDAPSDLKEGNVEDDWDMVTPEDYALPATLSAPRGKAVLVDHGSYNPPHLGQVRAMALAKERLEAEGFQVVSGLMGVAPKTWIHKKGISALPKEIRVQLIDTIAAECGHSSWLRGDIRGVKHKSYHHFIQGVVTAEYPGHTIFGLIDGSCCFGRFNEGPCVCISPAGFDLPEEDTDTHFAVTDTACQEPYRHSVLNNALYHKNKAVATAIVGDNAAAMLLELPNSAWEAPAYQCNRSWAY
mmetsp:Transcript_70985/g.170040  ORF Transcript_70985/g.170040 Transcript_70985/m.170040 type:complete len:579 (-) Transcript_70985:161-1897(-)